MFTPWIKRKSLKKDVRSKRLVVEGEPPSMIMLLSLSALLVLVGVFVVQRGMAADWWSVQPTPMPVVSPLSPTPTPSASVSASPVPTQGPQHRSSY